MPAAPLTPAPPASPVAAEERRAPGRLLLVISLGLVLLTLAAYRPLWDNDFVNLDDGLYITENASVLEGLTPRGIQWAWTTCYANFWIPLTWMSLQVDASVSGLLQGPGKPVAAVFHAQNLLWHCATTVLLFVLLRRLTGAVWRSALVAALFAVHPLHVESVAWATERKDVLSAFFWMLTLLAYVRYVERPGRGRYLLVVAAFVAGLLAKPMLVTLPFVLLLLDWWPLGRWGRAGARPAPPSVPLVPRQRPGWLLLEKVPLLLLALAAAAATFAIKQHIGEIAYAQYIVFPDRLANAVMSYDWYLEKTFWPTGLALYYCHPGNNWQWGPVLLSAAVLAAVTVLALGQARKQPWLLVGWLWFLGTLVPVIGLVQAGEQARADRFVYVPHIGLFVAVVWSAAALLERLRLPAAVRSGLAAACLLVLAGLTWLQVDCWRNSVTIWEHALAVTTGNHRAHACLAEELLAQAKRRDDPGLLAQAERHYQEAAALAPNAWILHSNLGQLLLKQGRLEEAAAQFQEAIRCDPKEAAFQYNLGTIRRLQKKYQQAADSFRAALELAPQDADTRAELGWVLWQLGQREQAEQHWQEALRLQPGKPPPQALLGRGLVLLRQGDNLGAVEQLDAALQDNPLRIPASSYHGIALGRLLQWRQAVESQREAVRLEEQHLQKQPASDPTDLACYRRRLAHALHALGRPTEAAQEYAEATRLDPGWPQRHIPQAWHLATAADPKERDPWTARELAEEVLQAGQEPSCAALDALAAAQAALGYYQEAARTADRALRTAAPGQWAAIQQRFRLYEARKPFVAGSD